MATSLTRDEHLVLQHLVSGKGTEDIAATLDLPLPVVRTHTHTLIARVLEQSEARATRPHPVSHERRLSSPASFEPRDLAVR